MATTVLLPLWECRHLRNFDRGDGTEISQLWKVHASWFNDFNKVIPLVSSPLVHSADLSFYNLRQTGISSSFEAVS